MLHMSSVFYVKLLQCFHYLTCACVLRTDSNSDFQPKIKKKFVHNHLSSSDVLHNFLFSGCILYSFMGKVSNCEGEKTCIILHNIFM